MPMKMQKCSGRKNLLITAKREYPELYFQGLSGLEHKLIIHRFVCATPALNAQRPTLFRTYDVHKNNNLNRKIWEAARATSAAPLFFKRVAIGEVGLQEEYVDGALGCNNPVNQVIEESGLIYGKERTIDCVVSIGTGQRDVTTSVGSDKLSIVIID
jgi:patatin-like phospholipase/acyl hydrolase